MKNDVVKRYVERRDERLRKRLDEEQWITIRGTHVMVDDDGEITKGPKNLRSGAPLRNKATPAKNLPPKETTPLRNGARIVRGTKGVGAEGRGKGAYPGIQSFGKEEPGESEALAKAGMMGEKAKKPDAVKRANKMKEMPEGTVIKTSAGDTFTKRGDNRWKVESKDGRVKIWDNKYAAALLNDDDVDGGSGKDKSVKESSSEAPGVDNVKKWGASIDKQAFTKKGENEWELIPKDKDISSAGASIKKVGNKYEVETWGTSDIQKSDLETRGKATLKSSWNSLAEAKTAAKEELKGYLPSVKSKKESSSEVESKGKRFVDVANIEKMPERPRKPNIERMNKVVDGVFKDLGGEVTGDYGGHSNTKYFSVPEKTPVKNLATNIVDSLRKKGYAAEFVKNTSRFRDLSDKPTGAIWVGNGTDEGTYGVTYEVSIDKDYRKSPGKVGVRLERVQSY